MTDNEANQIIAEFIDENPYVWVNGVNTGKLKFVDSMDTLVPVWEKLKCTPDFDWDWNENKHKDMYWCELSEKYGNDKPYGYTCAETIQQAAAHATAKAILNIKEL